MFYHAKNLCKLIATILKMKSVYRHITLIFCSYYFFLATGFEIPKIVCTAVLGMENGKIPDSAIVASSRYNQYWGPERGRLNEKKEGIRGFSVLDTLYK